MNIYNMSKHTVEINFDELKFNLYDLLAVSPDATEKKIKKAYRKLIIKFHPDKDNLVDEEIYNHLTIANQVLTNDDLRKKYDNWLNSFGDDNPGHKDLKQNFEDSVSQIKCHFPSMPSEAKVSYFEKAENLNNKHGVNNDFNQNTMEKYNAKKKELEQDIEFENLNIKNKNDFDNKFNTVKEDREICQDIIKSNGQIMEFNQQSVGDEYLSITNYSLLYSEDSIQGNKYSSLDNAFKLQPKMEFVEEDIEKKMKDYKNFSNDLSTLDFDV